VLVEGTGPSIEGHVLAQVLALPVISSKTCQAEAASVQVGATYHNIIITSEKIGGRAGVWFYVALPSFPFIESSPRASKQYAVRCLRRPGFLGD
jgi:hypothetical protein